MLGQSIHSSAVYNTLHLPYFSSDNHRSEMVANGSSGKEVFPSRSRSLSKKTCNRSTILIPLDTSVDVSADSRRVRHVSTRSPQLGLGAVRGAARFSGLMSLLEMNF